MSILYERILNLCVAAEIKPGRLCNDLGLSRGLMTDLKMGRKKGLSAETADKIANYFGVSVGYLLGTEQKESPAANSDEAAVPHAKYRDVLQQDGIRLLLDADAKVSQEDLDDIVEFIKFKRRKNEY